MNPDKNSMKMGCLESRILKNSMKMGCLESRILKLESLIPRIGNENLTIGGCVQSHTSNMENLRSGNESSKLNCVGLRNPEKTKPETGGLQNDVSQSGEQQTGKNYRGRPNAETSSARNTDSHVDEFNTKDNVLNVYEFGVDKHHKSESELPKYSAMNISSPSPHLSSGGDNVKDGRGWGYSDERPSQHGSSFQDKKSAFVNLVSDDESEDSDLKFPTGGLVDMLGMENGNRNKNEMKWESEADMLCSFEMDAEICMKAVCALYRQKISEDEIPPQGLYYQSDTLRCITLAKFLTDKDCEGALKKSVKELETLDSKAAYDCKMLAKRYSIFLFDIYKNRKDPYFLPDTTASHTAE